MSLDIGSLYAVGAGLVSGGIAWGGMYASIKGVKAEQIDAKVALTRHVEADQAVQIDMVDRLARIETKLDALRG